MPRLRWVAWGVLALLALVLLWFLRSLSFKSKPYQLPPVPEALRKKVAQAEEDALAAKVRAKAEAETAKLILEEAANIEDDRERRRRLAEVLEKL